MIFNLVIVIMISNLEKLSIIHRVVEENDGDVPDILMVTPHMDPDHSKSALWHKLKENSYIVKNILKADKQYEKLIEKVNKEQVIKMACSLDPDAPPIGTRHPINTRLNAVIFDTPQFNWNDRNFVVPISDIFDGDDPLILNRADQWEVNPQWPGPLRLLLKKHKMIPECISKLVSVKDGQVTKSSIDEVKFTLKPEQWKCGNRLFVYVPLGRIEKLLRSEVAHNHVLLSMEYAKTCIHIDGLQCPNNLRDSDPEIQKTGYHHSLLLTHREELKEEPEKVVWGAAQNRMTN